MDKKQKWRAKFEEENPTFATEVQGLSKEEKEQRIVTLTQNLDEIEQALENDENVERAREVLKELLAPYKEGKKLVKNKIKYVLEILKEQ